jgi:predicted nucleotidyltransferase
MHIDIDRPRIAEFCQGWQVSELALFGSVVRDDFRPDSDVDVLVDFLPDARRQLVDFEDMAAELALLFGRPVDVVSKRGLRPRVREEVLGSLQVVYAACQPLPGRHRRGTAAYRLVSCGCGQGRVP